MHLTDETMLPKIKRQIPEVYDVLQAEEQYLDVMIDFFELLRQRTVLLKAVVMNIPNLKAKIKSITGLDCEIIEYPEKLTLRLRYLCDADTPAFQWTERVLSFVPAHLKVIMEYLKEYSGDRRSYAGAAGSGSFKYRVQPVELNRKVKRNINLDLQSGGFCHTKLIAYPKEA